jgi:hypothetical protein
LTLSVVSRSVGRQPGVGERIGQSTAPVVEHRVRVVGRGVAGIRVDLGGDQGRPDSADVDGEFGGRLCAVLGVLAGAGGLLASGLVEKFGQAVEDAAGRCCIVGSTDVLNPYRGSRSDRLGKFVERRGDPQPVRGVEAKFVMSAVQVLYEGMSR